MTESHPIGTGERLKMLEDALSEIASLGKQAGSRHEVVMLNCAIDRARQATLRKDEAE